MNERKIQHDYVMKYLCSLEIDGGLGYRETANNIVSNDLFIPSHLAEFISNSEPDMWRRLIKNFGTEEELLKALISEIKSHYNDCQNAALFFNKYKSINFAGENVPLYYVSGTELRGDENFKKNIFAAVEESSHTIKVLGNSISTIRPDITFYLNGIYIGYLELKSVAMGQTAANQGRGKIIKDYLTAIKVFCELEKTNNEISSHKRRALSIFEKAIHLVASDCNENYVLRNIASLYDYAHNQLKSETTPNFDTLLPEFIKVFKEYPVTSQNLNAHQRFEQVMNALYSKKMIEKEILYYNFMEYKYERTEDGKIRVSHEPRLISPRPKQKFGCDKIMGRIVEMLEHEEEPNYYTDKLRKELIALDIPLTKVEEIILKRKQYCNNKYVYSLLMQYAAGFGKSNIIGWTALQLKDFRYKGSYAYDKIMLVVDRLQLRDQLDTTMTNMNIDKSMFIEAVDKKTFIDALDSPRRIIVVNIQKFLDLQEAINESGKKLRTMRVAFLIDEIHRSNSGENNKEMINLFERLQDSFKREDGTEIKKKNLLIGFTATPSEETLARFGEFKSAQIVPLWVPFDSYTMKEAIEDGYILDPTKHIFPFSVPIIFGSNIPEDASPNQKVKAKQSKDDIYSYEPRMVKIANFIVDRLLSLVYGKIRGTGKAMFAVSSIPNAIKYIDIIRNIYAEKCKEKQYAKYSDAPICIVYSDSQKYLPCASLNGGKTEAKVIQEFKSAKNGLIIVVDKLQTGFDEPKLHTLFLDKEINGINAIQTISRVNRTCKNKFECHVIDCSWQNVNIGNIKLAFKQFCNMTISDFNPEEQAKFIADRYKALCAYDLYKNWFNRYKLQKEDASFIINIEDAFRTWIKQCAAAEEAIKKHNTENGYFEGDPEYITPVNDARDLRVFISQYSTAIESIKNIYVIAYKYTEKDFLSFWQIYCKVYQQCTRKSKDSDIVLVAPVDIDEAGFTLIDDEPEEKGSKKNSHTGVTIKHSKTKTISDILKLIDNLNKIEAMSMAQVQEYLKEIGVFFQWLKDDTDICVFLKDVNFSDEQKQEKFRSSLNKYKRSVLKKRTNISDIDRFKILLTDNEAQLFAAFMHSAINHQDNADFDFDTTDIKVETKDELISKIEELFNPKLDIAKLKNTIIDKFKEQFAFLRGEKYAEFEDVIDGFFDLLNRESIDDLDGLNESVPDALNKYFFAKNNPTTLKILFKSLLLDLEAYLRKICYLRSGLIFDKYQGYVDVVREIPDFNELYYTRNPRLSTFKSFYLNVYNWRNKNAHAAPKLPDNEVDDAIYLVINMYIYATMVSLPDIV